MKRAASLTAAGRMRASGMRKPNAALLLNIIRENGPVSRAELARLTGLSQPTVSSQVVDLIERGIVVEDGAGEARSSGGKSPIMLRFDLRREPIAAAEIGPSSVRVWLAELDGRPFDSQASPITPALGAAHILILSSLCGTTQKMLAQTGRRMNLQAAAIAATGRMDADSGTVLEAGNVFHWRKVGIRLRLQDHFGATVAVNNDVNFAAPGEMRSGRAIGVQNFILIRDGTGIGAGRVFGGLLYRGTDLAAGEIGHMLVDRGAPLEDAAHRGWLELAIGSDRVCERVLSAHDGPSSIASTLSIAGLAGELASLVCRMVDAAARVLDEVASKVSISVADLAATIDCELTVLAGDLFGLVVGCVREPVGRVIPWPVRIELAGLGADAALMGATSSARGLAGCATWAWTRFHSQH
ncbi:MAG: ROK family transcriptional regulator [Acidobacteria bacterium]|nr:ROK family transcriptional regulator [Acidobacteriota bacterium]